MNALINQFFDEVRSAARFRWVALGVAWAVCLVGWTGVFMLPDRYQANARVFVDTRTALTPVIQGIAIQQDVAAQLNLVQQSLLSGPQMEEVARSVGLTSASMTKVQGAKIIDEMRKSAGVWAQASGGGSVYTISYTDTNRERGLKIVDLLLNSFVENTLGGKQAGAATAQKFLTDQINEYEIRLRQAEQRLADFKKRNVGVMPGAEGDYFSRLQKEMDAGKKAEGSLNVALKRREELARQLRGEVPVAAGNDLDALTGNDTASRIKESEAALSQLVLKYTDRHPDVMAMREALEQLKARRLGELDALKRGEPGAAALSGAAANPIYQSIQLALNQADADIATLRGEVTDTQRRIAELRKLVDTVPEVEAEYARLNRDYDVNKAKYSELLDRLERANLGDQAESTGALRFEIVDPPVASFEPVAPRRTLYLLMVLFAGIGAGGGLAYLLHFMRPVFNNSRAIHEITGLPVLGVVSLTWLDKYKLELRRSYIACGSIAACLLLVFAGVFHFSEHGHQFLQSLVGLG